MFLLDIDRKSILDPLQAVSGIVDKKHTMPILGNVLMECNGSELTLVATDVDIEVVYKQALNVPSLNPWSITAQAKKLTDILKSFSDESNVTMEMDGQKVQIRSGKSKFHLQTLPAENFPRTNRSDSCSSTFAISQGLLREVIASTSYAMSFQDVRYYLNGMLFIIEDTSLVAVATDGHRLAYRKAELESQLSSRCEIIIPRKTIHELNRLLSDSTDPVKVEIFDNQIVFSFASIQLTSKLIEGKFPDYGRVIPSSVRLKVPLQRSTLLNALLRISILATDKLRPVRLLFNNNSLTLVSTNNEQEEAREEIDIDFNSEVMDMGFNVSYLLDVLNFLKDSTIEIGLNQTNSSILITVPDREDFKYVVMPMRM